MDHIVGMMPSDGHRSITLLDVAQAHERTHVAHRGSNLQGHCMPYQGCYGVCSDVSEVRFRRLADVGGKAVSFTVRGE